jgi:elongation factor Ts
MPAITASLVNELRAKTGQPMMECKKMLESTGGDIEKAVDEFRKKGVKASVTGRAASEGRVVCATSADRKMAAAIEINCNTDFTAKSDAVEQVAQLGLGKLLAAPKTDLAADAQMNDRFVAASQTTGENVKLGRTAALSADGSGVVGSYLYSTAGKGKIAVLLKFSAATADDLVRDIGMHVAAARPIALTRDKVPADVIAKEKEIAVEQAKASGKPQQIAEKIAEGKMNAFFGERVLLDQEFINAEVFKGKVSDYLKKANTQLVEYVRIEVGQ